MIEYASINIENILEENMARTGLTIGGSAELVFHVKEEHAIDFADHVMPAVLSTPWLIWFLEHTAREAVLPFLKAGESTVGVRIEVDHLAATPLGQRVECRATIIQTDGRSVWFRLEAYDERELIAKGLHQLRIIQIDRFAARVRAKNE